MRRRRGTVYCRLRFFVLCLLLSWGVLGGLCWGASPVEVSVSGVTGAPLDNVHTALGLPPGLVHNGRVDRRWLDRFVRQVPQRVRQALEPYGYYHAEVQTELHPESAGGLRLMVRIHPGPAVHLATVHVRLSGPGAAQPALQQLVAAFPLQKGDVLRQELYEQAKGGLRARAIDLGYLDADFSRHAIRITRADNSAVIDLQLATGRRFRFGHVLIHGAPNFPAAFLRRYVAFKQGEIFSYAKLGQTQLNFLNSDRFREAIVTPWKDQARNGEVPVSIQLVPSSRRRLRPGIGYGTDTGARFTLRYQDVNVLHRGHEFAADFNIAQRRQFLGGSYTIPSTTDLQSHTVLQIGFLKEKTASYKFSSLFSQVEMVKAFTADQSGSVYLRISQEHSIVGGASTNTRLLLPGLRFRVRHYDNPVRPQRGYGYSLEVRGTDRLLGSEVSLVQGLADAHLLHPLPWRLTLLLRAQGATTLQSDPLADIPASLRFFAGGDQSVRGYSYQSLGPKDATGTVVGGKKLLVGSIELDRAIGEKWGVAVFYDAGNAFNQFSDVTLAQGAGIGLRRYTVVGPIKVDLARQIDRPHAGYRVHLSVGFTW